MSGAQIMGFTASYAGYSFYCSINGTYTITKEYGLKCYRLSYTYYWYMNSNEQDSQWQKNDVIFSAQPLTANVYELIYAKVKQDISPNYQIVDDL